MRTRHPAIAALLAASLASGADAATAEAASAGVLVNARIHTLDERHPVAEALAWDRDGRIVAVGARDEVLAKAPGAPVHDARGATVVPGLIDAHAHLMGLGFALMQADLVGARSKAEVLERLQAFAANLPDGAWLLGRGWDQNDWPDKTFPTAADLDADDRWAIAQVAQLAGLGHLVTSTAAPSSARQHWARSTAIRLYRSSQSRAPVAAR